jgi:hypothetical protein
MTDKNEQLTSRQEDCIAHIATTEKIPGKDARKKYFERVAKRLKNGGTEENLQEELLGKAITATKQAVTVTADPAPETKKKVVGGTWTQTKLGATVVLSPDFLKECGFNKALTTGEVGRIVKRILLANKVAVQNGGVE